MAFDYDLRSRRNAFRRDIQRLIESLENHVKTFAALGEPAEEPAARQPSKKPRAARPRARSAAAGAQRLFDSL
jgi:hypothetical protein